MAIKKTINFEVTIEEHMALKLAAVKAHTTMKDLLYQAVSVVLTRNGTKKEDTL
jgi:hypothetical protein